MIRKTNPFWLCFITSVFCTIASAVAGTIRCEIWHHLEGGEITDTLAQEDLSAPANETKSLDQFELNPGPGDATACAVRGYLTAPTTGDYTFFISADDTAVLYLSTDQSVANRRLIATVPTFTNVREYQRYTAQTSKPVHLLSGHKYFIEGLLKNFDGASHISVGWKLPDGSTEAPIPGNRLTPAVGNIPAPSYKSPPPKLTLDPNPGKERLGGFHKFVQGAHYKFDTQTVDMSYLVFLPMDFAKTTDRRPLMIFLHGNGHQGFDLGGITNEGPAQVLNDDEQFRKWFPMVALFPQIPPDWRWDRAEAPGMVNALIGKVCEANPRIDRRRIYLTGLSMGGKGSWLTALDSPGTFAAVTTFSAVAVRPRAAKEHLPQIRNIHIICGNDDGDFAGGSKLMYETLHPVMGNRVQFTSVEHEGHGVWGRYYPNKDIYLEMMKYSK